MAVSRSRVGSPLRSSRIAVAWLVLVPAACGGSEPKKTPETETVPWSRLTGKIALTQSSFDATNGFTGPSQVLLLDTAREQVATLKRFEASEGVLLSSPVWRADGVVVLFETLQKGKAARRAVGTDGADVALAPPLDDPDNKQLTWLRSGRLAWCRGGTIWIDGAPALERGCGSPFGGNFAWSPDGGAVVVTGHPDGYAEPRLSFLIALWWVDLASRGRRRVFLTPESPTPTQLPGQTFSPDGTQIAFCLDTGNVPPRRRIWLVSADGGPARQLTSGDWDSSPVWSPDGRQILYSGDGGLRVMNADGTGNLPLGFAGEAAWAP